MELITVQILVVVAIIHIRTMKAEEEKGFRSLVIIAKLAGPKFC